MIAMMGKPLASLSSGLLARKGQAKPAMRSQGFAGFAPHLAHPSQLEDLGWNDMGNAGSAPAPAPVAVPPVVALREALREEIETPPVETAVELPVAEAPAPESPVEAAPAVEPTPEVPAVIRPISIATAQRIGRDSAKQTKNGKAAFTLRLESERHLRLRLASALSGRSAQQLVTQALDELLTAMTDVDALIAQLPTGKRQR